MVIRRVALWRIALRVLALGLGLGVSPLCFAARTPEVSVLKAEKKELFDSLVYPARIQPRVSAPILADADGVVRQVIAPLGRKVGKRGAVLVIQNTDPIYNYAPVQVTTPVAGIVSQMEVVEGSRVARGQKLAVVTDAAQVRLTIEVSATDLGSIVAGMRGEFHPIGAGSATPVPVRVRGISPIVDPATGTAPAELEPEEAGQKPGAGRKLVAGMIGKVVFKANARRGFQVPEHALLYKEKDPFLRVVGPENKAKRVAVTLGRASRGQVEILTGINEGDRVVERASGYVADGEEVKVQGDEPQAPTAAQAAGSAGSK